MNSVIITAGGIGKRMDSEIPKQFLPLAGIPVLMHTIQRFHDFDPTIQIIVTLPNDWQDYWQELLEKHQFKTNHIIVQGGQERYHSIKNALELARGEYIAIHDGVRPNVSHKTIKTCFEIAQKKGNCVPFLPIHESLRKIDKYQSTIVNRNEYIIVQTPQCFERNVIKHAYEQDFHSGITDDASLLDQLGIEINLIEGNPENCKITTPMDLKIATLFI